MATRIRLEEFPGRVAQQHRLMVQRLGLGIWRRITLIMPVDTGWARFHTVLTYQQPDQTRPGTYPEGTEPNTYPAPEINTQRPPLFPTVYIQNRVPYVEWLNQGSSTQAPELFWETAVAAEMSVLRRSNRRGPYVR